MIIERSIVVRLSWTQSETQALIKQADRPIQELEKMFPRHPKSSIRRKIARLRAEGKIGCKSPEVVKEAYLLRSKTR